MQHPSSDLPPPIAWSPEQAARLEHEWRQLRRTFAFHPAVRVTPLQDAPPAEYQIDLRVRTLHVRDDGQLDYIDAPTVHIWIPPGYPHEPPLVRPVEALFHPNVTMDGILISPPWETGRTLTQLVQQVATMLAFRTYDPAQSWNPAAMEWVTANPGYLPTDAAADFTPGAGGEPLARILEKGEAALAQLRQQFERACDALIAADHPPTIDDLRSFCRHARLTTALFFEADIPAHLQEPARELDQWAQALPGATVAFEILREHRRIAAAALQAAGQLAEARRLLLRALSALEDAVTAAPSADPREALSQLPDVPHLHAHRAPFKLALGEADRRLADAKALLADLTPPAPHAATSPSTALDQTLTAETDRAARAAADASEKVRSAIDTILPTVQRARDELAALERVIGWREYESLHANSRDLAAQVRAWGAAAVQAYFVENEGGTFGPFEFEQRLELGESALAVRNTSRAAIAVYDLATGSCLASNDTGRATVDLPGAEPGTAYPTTFRTTARCEDLAAQLELLTRAIGERVLRLTRPIDLPLATSWAAAYHRVLSSPLATEAFVDETREGARLRDELVTDLKLLARFKERLATQFLLERQSEMVLRFRQMKDAAQAQFDESSKKLAAIFARSPRDLATNQPLIPPKLLSEYETHTTRRDEAQQLMERLDRRFATAVTQIKPRLANPRLYGSDRVPALSVLSPPPDDLLSRAELLADFEMLTVVSMLESELGVRLRPETPLPPLPPISPTPSAELFPDDQPPPVLPDEEFPQRAHEESAR